VSPALSDFLALDLAALLTAACAGVSCALLGSLLLLRRQSLLGDAISHAVLPGLVAAFILAGTRAGAPMFIGAAIAGVGAALLVELVRRSTRLDDQTATAVVFPVMFALGVVLIEQTAASGVDLDVDCVFNGLLERVIWLELADGVQRADLAGVPRELITSATAMLAIALLVAVFFKEIRLCSFDPALAGALGFRPGLVGLGLTVLTAGAVVASFEAVGSILVLALLVCPAATARLLTDRFGRQLWLSVILGLVASVGGYFAATRGPMLLGSDAALSAAGMMAVVAGLLLLGAALFAPRHGVLGKALRRAHAGVAIAREDLLADLHRLSEGRPADDLPTRRQGLARRVALAWATRRGEVQASTAGPALTARGRTEAQRIVRAHRQWETYLVREVGLRPDHVHDAAERLEHAVRPDALASPDAPAPSGRDPQGREIPPAV
jgi:manganese/zinc/iron transport system permease protein